MTCFDEKGKFQLIVSLSNRIRIAYFDIIILSILYIRTICLELMGSFDADMAAGPPAGGRVNNLTII